MFLSEKERKVQEKWERKRDKIDRANSAFYDKIFKQMVKKYPDLSLGETHAKTYQEGKVTEKPIQIEQEPVQVKQEPVQVEQEPIQVQQKKVSNFKEMSSRFAQEVGKIQTVRQEFQKIFQEVFAMSKREEKVHT